MIIPKKTISIVNRLLQTHSFIQGNVQNFVVEAISQIFPVIQCSRIGFWLFNNDDDSISCLKYYEGEHFLKGETLKVSTFPHYFEKLRRGKTLIAPNAQIDSATRELVDPYLIPQNIFSLLDCGIFDGEKIVGIICFENKDKIKKWSASEIQLAKNTAILISACFQMEQKNSLLMAFNTQEKELNELKQTLKHVLSELRDQQMKLKKDVAINVEKNIYPILEKIKGQVSRDIYSSLEVNIDELTTNFYRRLARFNYNLTSSEVKICQMIHQGLRAKEIAEKLNLSLYTVETHKKNIRKKLGLKGKSINLKFALEQLNRLDTDG